MDTARNRLAKDTAFELIFSKEKYQRDVVHRLFGGRLDGAKIEAVTMRNIFLSTWYNDLGLLVGDTLVLLVEVQSIELTDFAIKILTHYAETLSTYLSSRGQQVSLCGTKKITLPRISLFCVYTGTKPVHGLYRLSDYFQESVRKSCSCEVTVNVITKDSAEAQGALGHYIRFCEILSESCREVYGAAEIAQRVVDRCTAEDIFVDVVLDEGSELVDTLLEDEYKIKQFLNDEDYQCVLIESLIAEKCEEAAKEATAKALAKELTNLQQSEKALLAVVDLIYDGLSREEILARTRVDVLTVPALKARYERVQGKKKPSDCENGNKNIVGMKLD